ncbi:hypothetical protein AB0N56_34745 [Streptomyces microflavus]|uniref:hypothetical protein n=1 Tax=Streptomyces microflavus TaxID=1919 RepID=UPI0034253FBC
MAAVPELASTSARRPGPDPAQFAMQVKGMLVEAGATAAAQVGIQMAEQARSTLV